MGIVCGTISVEMPKHEVLLRKGSYEIRKYPRCIVAEVEHTSDNEGFNILANYIFGNNKTPIKSTIAMTAPVITSQSEKVAMTAPVVTSESNQNMSFIMPSE